MMLFSSSSSLLFFCLVDLSIIPLVRSLVASCMWKHCFLIITYLELLLLLGKLTLLSLCNNPLFLVVFFDINCTLSDINIAIPGLSKLEFVWYIFVHLFPFFSLVRNICSELTSVSSLALFCMWHHSMA